MTEILAILRKIQEQREDWAHDRLVGWESARLSLARQTADDEHDLRVIVAERRVERLGGLHCPIHGQEAYKDGGRAYFKTMRADAKTGASEVRDV